jgi:MHS family proline/betaine transporter-like MFS transporter
MADKLEQTAERKALRRAASASFRGNFVEWFDYAAYGYLATVIALTFFPQTDKATALLATFAVFALSFIVRPLGGLVWGHFGDRYGRRSALSWSILIMSISTFCIGILPTYNHIGLWAPALLLLIRLFQGFSASGEYAGASAFLAEYAPEGKRGLYTSIVPASTAAGLLFGAVFVAGLHAWMSVEDLHSWGWRLPFLHRRSVMIGIGATCLNAVAFYLLLSYMPTYLSTEMGMSESDSFLASTVSLATYIGLIFLMGKLSDRFGRKTMLVTASVLFLALTFPLFGMLENQPLIVILMIQIAFGAILAMNDGTLPCFLAEIFPTRVRFSGFAFSFNIANAVFGGTAPFIATWLIQLTGNKMAPAWYLLAAAAVALIAMLASRETAHKALQD